MFRSISPSLRRLTALGAVALLGLAACGSDDAESAASAPAPTEAPAVSEAPAATDAPMTSDAPAALKIVSLSPSATEMLFAIGAGADVIAVDDQSNFPDEALAVQTDLSGYTPNVEAIAKYEPDLVVHDGTTDLSGQLKAIGIADWVGAAPVTFDDIYAQIEQLGAATGRVGEAAGLRITLQSFQQILLPVVVGALAALLGVQPLFWLYSVVALAVALSIRHAR